MEFSKLSKRIIGCAIEVHRQLGPGLLESIYEQCLAHELGCVALSSKPNIHCQWYTNARDGGKAANMKNTDKPKEDYTTESTESTEKTKREKQNVQCRNYIQAFSSLGSP